MDTYSNADCIKALESLVEIKLLPGAKMPVMMHDNDACYDVFAYDDLVTIEPGQVALVSLGFHMAMRDGWEAELRMRSGIAGKTPLIMPNAPGTIDAGYRGEVKVLFRNVGTYAHTIHAGERIAQMGIRRVPSVKLVEVDELGSTLRGTAGFGSTGI